MSRLNGLPLNPQPNLPLVPNELGKLGNAVLLGVIDGYYVVVTDFGNSINYTYSGLIERYSVPDWYYEMPKDYPRATLRERFTSQIVLLHDALRKLDGISN